MFDFAWSEIAVIGVVALIAIGPKDLPLAIKGVTDMIKKARRMAGEFQTHVDEMMREADLQEVRSSINEIRRFDIKGTIERNLDPDGTLRSTLKSNPLAPDHPRTVPDVTPVAASDAIVTEPPAEFPAQADLEADGGVIGADAPPFIPPGLAVAPTPPAFIPPAAAAALRSQLRF